jgi:hypothetical protein
MVSSKRTRMTVHTVYSYSSPAMYPELSASFGSQSCDA